MGKWMEAFKTGIHTDGSGQKKEWTTADLQKMADSYDPAEHEAPMVIGHPANNAPAYGWVTGLKVVGNKLMANGGQMEPQFVEMVRAGRFKKRSIAVYPDGTLRHLGFLGAHPPAVKGLKDVSFSDDQETKIYEYQEIDMTEIEKLREELAAEKAARKKSEEKCMELGKKAKTADETIAAQEEKAKKTEIDAFVESLQEPFRSLWKKEGIAEFMAVQESNEISYEFAEGSAKIPPGKWFRNFLQSFGEHPLFKKMAPPPGDGQQDRSFAEDKKVAQEIAGFQTPAK